MKARTGSHDDGMIGLGVLAMLTVALVAGQAHDSAETAAHSGSPTDTQTVLFSDETSPPSSVDGAIREMKILPAFIQNSVDLDWSSDDELLDSYRNRGF